MSPSLVYAFDPLCGWCFAFRPVIRALREITEARADWLIGGCGLVKGARAVPMIEAADYLRRGMAAVEKRTMVRFGAPFTENLLKSNHVAHSEPPCRAIFLAQEMGSSKQAFEFAEALTSAFYEDGQRLDDDATLLDCAEQAALDGAVFLQRFHAPESKAATAVAFAAWEQRGVTSYPAILIETPSGALRTVLSGYVDLEVALTRLEGELVSMGA
jgi:putative protein-disulfide isomerase